MGDCIMKPILLAIAISLFLTGICIAAEDGFETTSGGIAESLLAPDKGESPGPKTKDGGWQPLNTRGAPIEKTRAIKVLKKEKGVEVWETVKAPEKRTGGFVNLKIQNFNGTGFDGLGFLFGCFAGVQGFPFTFRCLRTGIVPFIRRKKAFGDPSRS